MMRMMKTFSKAVPFSLLNSHDVNIYIYILYNKYNCILNISKKDDTVSLHLVCT